MNEILRVSTNTFRHPGTPSNLHRCSSFTWGLLAHRSCNHPPICVLSASSLAIHSFYIPERHGLQTFYQLSTYDGVILRRRTAPGPSPTRLQALSNA
ncbi:UNVERIFIED_CONTAM: hypothetical protein Sangu_2732400 [Sesamum angustifolium]|uniref:Uncharacterized protein n=1 Tax=Sesamum angustifolium TaxID=2727405 RepID=A0AAW2IVX8_9LAMI